MYEGRPRRYCVRGEAYEGRYCVGGEADLLCESIINQL